MAEYHAAAFMDAGAGSNRDGHAAGDPHADRDSVAYTDRDHYCADPTDLVRNPSVVAHCDTDANGDFYTDGDRSADGDFYTDGDSHTNDVADARTVGDDNRCRHRQRHSHTNVLGDWMAHCNAVSDCLADSVHTTCPYGNSRSATAPYDNRDRQHPAILDAYYRTAHRHCDRDAAPNSGHNSGANNYSPADMAITRLLTAVCKEIACENLG